MDNLISRQAAIEALEKMSANYGKIGRREWHPHIEECKSELRMLPSAQLEERTNKRTETHACDLIDRRMAIDEITEYSSGNSIYMSVGELKRRIEALPSAQQWIPCSERMPDKECFALVTVNDGAIYTDLSLFRHDGKFIEHTGDVIAWMPLPEPYRGEEK